MADQNNAPEMPDRIWLDERTFNGAVGFAHSKQHHPGDWAEYIRAGRAAPEGQVLVEALLHLRGLYDCADVVDAALASREAPPAAQEPVCWRDDPSADERWNAGCDYALDRLCEVLRVDPEAVSWDAATETLDGDVRAVIGNILTAAFGDDWPDAAPPPACQQEAVTVTEVLQAAITYIDKGRDGMARNILYAALRTLKGDNNV